MCMRRALPALLVALGACGGPTGPDVVEQLEENEIRVNGRISSASRLLSLPVHLGVPGPGDQFGEQNILVSTVSNEDGGRYELRALVDPPLCDGEFTVIVYDAFGRFAGKRIRGCGQHNEDFNVGPGFPT